MSKVLLLTLTMLFMVICMKLVLEDEWYLVASLIVGLLTQREQIKQLFDEASE